MSQIVEKKADNLIETRIVGCGNFGSGNLLNFELKQQIFDVTLLLYLYNNNFYNEIKPSVLRGARI